MFKLKSLFLWLTGQAFTLHIDGGGGGGGNNTPADTTNVQTTELPEWARGYAKDTLARGQALTDIGQHPYQQYGGDRVAGLSSLQQQAITGAGVRGFNQTVGGYMSPYMQNVVEQQQRNAREQAGMQAGALNAKAAQMNAFGGSGVALQRAAQGRELQRQLGDIQSTGLQNAYQQATQQYNTGQQQLATLGALQQQNRQQQMDVGYQNFLNEQNYPYQQLSYFSNLLRGAPMGMTATSQMYQAPPTAVQNLAALGAGAYGLSQLSKAADGGLMQSYAGGGAVAFGEGGLNIIDKFNDEGEMRAEMADKTDEQLQAIIKHPATKAEYDAAVATLQGRHQREAAMQASEQSGLASAFNQIPYSQRESMVRAASGGILKYAEDGLVNSSDEGETPDPYAMAPSPGNPRLQKAYGDKMMEVIKRMEESPGYVPSTRAQTRAAELAEYKDLQRFAGPDIYAPALKRLEDADAARLKNLEQAKGLAALSAIPAILQPGGTMRGLGAGIAKWGEGFGHAVAADQAEKKHLDAMQFNIADAKRKEALGLTKEARTSVQAAETNRLNAYKASIQRDQAIGNMLGKGMQATRPVGGSGGGPKEPKMAERLYSDTLAYKLATQKPKDGETDQAFQARMRYEAGKETAAQVKTSDYGPTRAALTAGQTYAKATTEVQKAVKSQALMDQDYLNATAAGDADAQAAALDRLTEAQLKRAKVANPGGGGGGGGGENTTPPPPGFHRTP